MRVDHLVWYAADLAEGERQFAGMMDNAPAYGGVHPGEGTRNALVALGDQTYVEILARDPAQDAAALDGELRNLKSAGLYHWAVGGVDLGRLRARAIAAGLDASELVNGGRSLPDGRPLRWMLFGVKNHGFGALVPFFIDWKKSEHPAKTAPCGGRLAEVKAFSPDAEKLRRLYDALGLDIPVETAARPRFRATIESKNGRHELAMVDPVPRGFVI